MYLLSYSNFRFSIQSEDEGQDTHEDKKIKAVGNMLPDNEDELLAGIWMILLFISIT